MAFKPVDVVAIIKTIAESVVGCYFAHGEGIEVFNELVKKGNVNLDTYPLIYLKQDFTETANPVTETTDVRLNLFILTPTQTTLTASDRYTTTFLPVLYPIYEAFINALGQSKLIQRENGEAWKSHNKTDHLFWGTETIKGNMPFDVIEIDNLELKLINKRC